MASRSVQIAGGGPAGCAAARLLARWGHDVELFHQRVGKGNPVESLAPSAVTALSLCGVRAEVEQAGFAPALGNVLWWGDRAPEVAGFGAGRTGLHVTRPELDDLMLRLAREAGVVVREQAAQAADLDAPYVIIASGRAGLALRQAEHRTVCMGALWRKAGGFPYAGHTWMEAHRDGWAWSAPRGADVRLVAVMVDGAEAAGGVYRRELAKAPRMAECLEDAALESEVYACDATVYAPARVAEGNRLFIGDSASCVDPLASFGLKKALTSAWLAAVAIHTALVDPGRQALAFDYFAERERQAFADLARGTAGQIRAAGWGEMSPFWRRRSRAEDWYSRAAVEAAAERLRSAGKFDWRCSSRMHRALRPAVHGNEIVLAEAQVIPELPAGMEFLNGVHVPSLLAVVEPDRDPAELYEKYRAGQAEVDFANFLGVLALLCAVDGLRFEGGGS